MEKAMTFLLFRTVAEANVGLKFQKINIETNKSLLLLAGLCFDENNDTN